MYTFSEKWHPLINASVSNKFVQCSKDYEWKQLINAASPPPLTNGLCDGGCTTIV